MSSKKMTKVQAIRSFREIYNGPKGDTVARSQAWNDYTDGLVDDRMITRRQCDTWTNPF